MSRTMEGAIFAVGRAIVGRDHQCARVVVDCLVVAAPLTPNCVFMLDDCVLAIHNAHAFVPFVCVRSAETSIVVKSEERQGVD